MRCLCPHYQETDGGWCCLEAVRPLAVARKVSHGSQGEGGLRTREVLGSVLLTLRLRHGRDA